MNKPLGNLLVYWFIPLFITFLSVQRTVEARSVNVDRLKLALRADLNSCLTGLNVTLPGDPAFSSESQTFNARLSYTPAAIVLPYVLSQPFGGSCSPHH
jgi:hypothetical protein